MGNIYFFHIYIYIYNHISATCFGVLYTILTSNVVLLAQNCHLFTSYYIISCNFLQVITSSHVSFYKLLHHLM